MEVTYFLSFQIILFLMTLQKIQFFEINQYKVFPKIMLQDEYQPVVFC